MRTAQPKATQRQQQADDTRTRMIELAWDHVRQRGQHAFTMRQLALAAGVATGLPHVHFGTRDELLDQLRIRVWDRIDAVIGEAHARVPANAPRRHEAAVRGGIAAVVQFALAEPHLYDLVALVPGARLSADVLARELRTAQPFIEFLRQGQAAGELRFTGDPIVFALALWTSVQGYVQRMGAVMPAPFRHYQARVLDEILDAFFARARHQESP